MKIQKPLIAEFCQRKNSKHGLGAPTSPTVFTRPIPLQDNHLFWSLSNHMRGQFDDEDHLKMFLEAFFRFKVLEVIDTNEEYIIKKLYIFDISK